MTIASLVVAAVGLGAPSAAPALAATQSTVAVDPDRSPGNARMSDGLGKQVQALELEATIAPSVLFADAANPGYQTSYTNWGFAVSGSFTYRARYFLNPTMLVGYTKLASGESKLPDDESTWGPGGTMKQSLSCWSLSPGVIFPFWRFRLAAGLGLAFAKIEDDFLEETNSSTQVGILNRVALSFDALKTDHVRLAGFVQYEHASGLKLKWLTFGVSFRGDFVQWD